MKMYLSGSSLPQHEDHMFKHNIPRLISFAYQKDAIKYCEHGRMLGVKNNDFMLDSGAYTSWSKGVKIELDTLSDFFEHLQSKYSEWFNFVMINLDVIPGEPGFLPSQREMAQGMIDSKKNYEVLNKRFPGQIIPVFHRGEPLEYFQELASMTEYICLGPGAQTIEKLKLDWVGEFMQYKQLKFHGLAATSERMMRKLPWYSVDSSSWLMGGRFGSCIIELETGRSKTILFSVESRHRQTADKHYDTLAAPQQKRIKEYVEDKGYTIKQLRNEHILRGLFNMDWFFAQSKIPYKKQTVQQGLF